VLSLGQLGWTFDAVIDSGPFHVFDDEQRARLPHQLGIGAAPGQQLLPDVLQRPPARRRGPPRFAEKSSSSRSPTAGA
jgi:hypothetical protein